MKDVELRQFKPADQEAVWQLHVKGLEQNDIYDRYPEFEADLNNIESEYIRHKGDFLVATLNGNIVGIGGLRKVNDNTAEIKRMRVDQKSQNQGIGNLILDSLIQKAKDLGYKRLILDTTKQMQTAQHLYKNRGFKEYDRKTFGNFEIILYELDLPESPREAKPLL